MGYSGYDQDARSARTVIYKSQSTSQKFEQKNKREIHPSMVPAQAKLRESRDSEEHPNSVAIIIALDVTGSMGYIPEMILDTELPKIIEYLQKNGVDDPQILFMAIGDHIFDEAPLQVGQFESGDEEMDMWLKRVWPEGHGGGNRHESYPLAWYFAANHTEIDCFEKRGQKGFIFTIGDELPLSPVAGNAWKSLMGLSEAPALKTKEELYEAAKEKYNIFHLHVEEGSYGTDPVKTWKNLMGENCISLKDYKKIPSVIAQTIVGNLNATFVKSTVVSKEKKEEEVKSTKITW